MEQTTKTLARLTVGFVAGVTLIAGVAGPVAAQDDNQRPSVASSRISVQNVGETSASSTWGAATDNLAVTGYNIYLNGVLADRSDNPAAVLDGLAPSTTYSMYVRAFDAAGNVGWRSGTTTFRTDAPTNVPDTTRPSVPSSRVRLDPNGRTLRWGGSIDDRGPVSYEVYDANTNAVIGTSVGNSYTFSRDVQMMARVYVSAVDEAGNRSYRTGILSTQIGDPDRPSIPGAISFSRNGDTVRLNWTASVDNIGIDEYRIYDANTNTVIATSPTNSAQITDGSALRLYLKAADANGNESFRTGIRTIPAN